MYVCTQQQTLVLKDSNRNVNLKEYTLPDATEFRTLRKYLRMFASWMKLCDSSSSNSLCRFIPTSSLQISLLISLEMSLEGSMLFPYYPAQTVWRKGNIVTLLSLWKWRVLIKLPWKVYKIKSVARSWR